MKSSTYASIATIVFVKYKNHISKNLESVIRATDRVAKKLGLDNDLSHMTKYRIVRDLLDSRILVTRKTNKYRKLKLSKTVTDLV